MPKKASEQEWRDDDTVEKILKNTVIGPWKEIGVSQETMDHFQCRVKYLPNSGPFGNLAAVYFPAYNSDYSKIIGFQRKDLTLDKNADYHFTNIGTVNVKNPMFFQNLASPSANHVYISEGPKDALCWYEAMWQETKPEWRDMIPPVVSILLGTPNGKQNIKHNEEFIKQYRGTYLQKGLEKKRGPILMMDNDEAEPGKTDILGKEATAEIAALLRDEYVQTLNHPDYIHDVADYLKLGKTKLLFEKSVFQTTEYRSEKIVALHDVFEKGEMQQPIRKGIFLPSYPKLMRILMGFREAELTLLLAPSGVGKTTISSDMFYEIIESQGRGCAIMLEEDLKKTFQRFIARRLKVNLRDLRLGTAKFTQEAYDEAEAWVADEKNLVALNHSGTIQINQLESLAKLMVYKYDVKYILFDHLTLATSGSKTANEERMSLDHSMTMLAALCESTGVSITVVAHVNRGVQQNRDRKIDTPTWQRTFAEDARGSSSCEALAFNIILLDRELLPNGRRGRVRLGCGKNREAGNTGFADILIQDDSTGLMIDATDYIYNSELGMVPPGTGYGTCY